MASITTEKLLHFSYQSKMKDVGLFRGTYLLKRETPKLQSEFIRTKAAMTDGIPPYDATDRLYITTVATLNSFVVPCDEKGQPLKNITGWIDDIRDRNILFEIYREVVDFHNSFYASADDEKPSMGNGTAG